DGLSAEDRNRYIESWRNYKLFRNTTFLSSVVLVFFGVLASKIGQTSVWPLLTILALALTIVSGLATELWKCPRCGNTFSGAKRQPWIRKCDWCELRKRDLATLSRSTHK